MNHIRLLAFALDNYHAQYGHFPPACTTDADGKPMHSWRVYLLPDFGRNDLYKRYDFSQPWNSPTNQQLAASMPDVFRCPGDPATGSNCTNYVAVVGPNTAWPGSTPRKLADFGEHADETILLVEIADSDINWLEPRDLSFEEAKTGIHGPGEPGISSHHLQYDRYFNHGDYCAVVVFANRHTQFLSTRTPPETLESLLTIGGPKSIDWGPPAQNHSRRDRKVAVIVIAITFLLLVLRPKLPEVQ